MPDYSLTEPAVAMFVVIPLILVTLLMAGANVAYRPAASRVVAAVAVGSAAWMAATWALASSGVLRDWERTPPPLFLLLLAIIVIGLAITFSPFGSRLVQTVPIWVLILVQAFRLPLEIAMHVMYERGIMPVQMSYSGYNFDIVTGVTAIIVAWLVRRGQRTVALTWNLLGLALLVNVGTVAILATPRFRFFGDEHLNVWVTYPPFVWLPAIMVLAAWTGHLLIFRSVAHLRVRP